MSSRLLEEAQLVALAGALAPLLAGGGSLHLEGELGTGKTTFARALLRALGVDGRIKSPTYSLVEPYQAGNLAIHHLDLYRIADPSELEWLGLDALWQPGSLVLVEWPERGSGALPPPDLRLVLTHAGDRRRLDVGAGSTRGLRWLQQWPGPAERSDT